MDEQPDLPMTPVGELLRAARTKQKKSIEDVASVTRIPTRHLSNLEDSNWAELPAPTYTMGFAKAYAGEVGLDRHAIGEQLKGEMDGWVQPMIATPDYVEPSDPKRAMPKGLIIASIVAIALLALLLNWLANRQAAPQETPAVAEERPTVALPNAAPAAVTGPVVLTATDRVWLRITDGTATLKQGEMAAGESFTVPATAANPMLSTGRAEALAIKVGDRAIAPVGAASVRIDNVSLKPEALLALPAATAAPATATAPAATSTAAPLATAPAPRRVTAPIRRPAPRPAATAPAPSAAPDATGGTVSVSTTPTNAN